MLAKVGSGAIIGLNGIYVDVEVDVSEGSLPSFTIVGLADKAVEESKDRVRSAIKNSGADFPTTRITVNLAPADLPKAGPAYDLPIALGILIASGQIQASLEKSMFFGELSLDGGLRHTNGILPMTYLARNEGAKNVFVPSVDMNEASLVPDVNIYPTGSLLELVRHLSKTVEIKKARKIGIGELIKTNEAQFNFAEIVGQESAKRALEIGASGGHNIFMRGAPGSGKTMLARAISGILPKITEEEALEVTKIYSITGNLPPGQSLVTSRPFRSPHHTTSRIGLIGGGSNPIPGEISLAHRGVLFLDEFPEFPRHVLESLRQPIEDGIVTISRAKATIAYPSKFMLVGAANPCPCGFLGDLRKPCRCSHSQISRYKKRISGPLLDRIDIHLDVPSVETQKLVSRSRNFAQTSEVIQQRVQKARDSQILRFKGTKIRSNSEMTTSDIKKYCELRDECLTLLRSAIANFNLSARSYFKVIKIARTIGDLAGENEISTTHIAEALTYRPQTAED